MRLSLEPFVIFGAASGMLEGVPAIVDLERAVAAIGSVAERWLRTGGAAASAGSWV